MSEQFCLRWNNHQSTLISVFETLLESGSLIDCTLCAEGQLLKGHKVVLSACSPIFESMLCIQEDKHPIIFLKDVKFIELKAMLDYMYKGEVNILQDQLDSFLRTAAALQIKGLTDQGGGGGDEPPAKKGPGRKTGMSDAPESPLVGNAPLREGSVSPTRRRRRLPRRPSSAEDASADNCDIPPPAVAPPAITPATQAPLPVVESLQRSSLTVKAKQEPIDTPLVTPKQEFVEETNEEIEDLTLDDDDDYNDSMSDLSKPGTSYGAMNPGSTSQQDFSQWQQMMGAADRSGTDEVFMAAQEAINNQANTQDFDYFGTDDDGEWKMGQLPLTLVTTVPDVIRRCPVCFKRTKVVTWCCAACTKFAQRIRQAYSKDNAARVPRCSHLLSYPQPKCSACRLKIYVYYWNRKHPKIPCGLPSLELKSEQAESWNET